MAVTTRISAKNFRSYVSMDAQFSSGEIYAIVGNSDGSDYANTNGSGKSSVMFAYLWALFGKWPGMSSADSCVNTAVGKGCSVTVEFVVTDREFGGKVTVKIVRSRKPNKLTLFIDGQEVQGDVAVLQERINRLVDCDYEFFVKTHVFTGEQSFRCARMTSTQMKNILDALLPKWNFDPSKAAAKVKEIGSKIDRNNGAIELMLRNIDKENEAVNTISKQVGTESYVALTQQIANLQQDVDNATGNIKIQKQFLGTEREYLETIRVAVSDWNVANDIYMRGRRDKEQQKAILDQRVDKLSEKASRLSATIKDERAKRASMESTSLCYTCGQHVKPKNLEVLVQAIDEKIVRDDAELVETVSAINDCKVASGNLAAEIALIGDPNPWIFPELPPNHYPPEYHQAANNARDREVFIREQESLVAKWTMELETLNKQLSQFDPSVWRSRMKQAQDRITEYNDDVQKYSAENEALKNDQTVWSFVQDALGKKGIFNQALMSLLPSLNYLLRINMAAISEKELVAEFVLKDNASSELVVLARKESSNGNVGNYDDLSSGEKARVDVAVFLTVLTMYRQGRGDDPTVVFLDEVADSLDTRGKEAVCRLLEDYTSRHGDSVVMITNDNNVSGFVRNVLTAANGGLR